MSQLPPGQQPQYPQGYPQQGQYPQQYPQPYSPYQMPQVHPMAYAQAQMQGLSWQYSRAGMMLIITGILMGVCGLGCGALSMAPLDELMANAQMDPELAALMTPQLLKVVLLVVAGGSLLYAVLAVLLGFAVRKQSKGAAIGGIVLTLLVLAYLVVSAISGLFQAGKMGPQGMLGECVLIVPLVICVWQFIWLIGAVRSARPLAAMQGQMQMQYWQMMQMQQAQQQQQYQQMMAMQQAPAQNSEGRNQKSEGPKEGGEGGPGPPPT